MIEGIKLTQAFYKAPAWKNYIVEQTSPSQNATDAELEDFIRNTTFSSQHAVGTAAMSAVDATYGVVNPDLRVKGASGLRIVDGSVMVRNCLFCFGIKGRLTYLMPEAFYHQRAYPSACICYCRASIRSHQGILEITIGAIRSRLRKCSLSTRMNSKTTEKNNFHNVQDRHGDMNSFDNNYWCFSCADKKG